MAQTTRTSTASGRLGGTQRRLLDPTACAAEPAGTFIVQSDDQLVATAARRLKRWDKNAFAALGTTQAVIEAHAARLARAVDLDAGQDAARGQALTAMLAADALTARAVQDLATTLALHPVVVADIEARVTAGVAAGWAEVDAELGERRAELEAASSAAVVAEEVRLVRLRDERAQLEQAVATLEIEVRRAIDRQIAAGIQASPTVL